MEKNLVRENNAQSNKWLERGDIWVYDEITRYFREAGYSWKCAQKKTDIIMRCD